MSSVHKGFIVLILLLSMTACTSTVPMESAQNANNPGCADILVRLPDDINGHQRRFTNAQATSAWGSPASILLKCGVPPLEPTTKPCSSVNSIDWALISEPHAPESIYQTFGRIPATEVAINTTAGVTPADVLLALASSLVVIPQTSSCS